MINLPELVVLVSASTDSVFGFFGSSSLSSSNLLFGVELALALSSMGLPPSDPDPWGVGGLSRRLPRLLIGAEILGTEFSFSASVLSANASSGSESSGAAADGGLWHPWSVLRQWLTLCSINLTMSPRGYDALHPPHCTVSGLEPWDVSAGKINANALVIVWRTQKKKKSREKWIFTTKGGVRGEFAPWTLVKLVDSTPVW